MTWILRFLQREAQASIRARVKGVTLLRCNLSPEQDALYEMRGYFIVVGGVTGRRYRIRNRRQLNVEALDRAGRVSKVLCFGPSGGLPIGDCMLAQKLALELYEDEALRVANRNAIGRWPSRH